ncbi:MAG: serine protease [Granulosicoccus sp.]
MKRKETPHAISTGFAITLIAATMSLSTVAMAQDNRNLPEGAKEIRLFGDDWKNLEWVSEFARFEEIKRDKRKPVRTDKFNMLPGAKEDGESESAKREIIKPIDQIKGEATFEFYDIESSRTFQLKAKQSDMASFSRLISETTGENSPGGKAPSKVEIQLEDSREKSWSNAHDSRSRRGIANGFSDTHSIYQNLANYGGCSATVLSASSTRMVAITAAHCVFRNDYSFNYSRIQPRKDGSTSPTWGSWTPYAFGYYPAYINNNCEGNWNGSNCIKHDIALVIAYPNAGASAPSGMGWGARPKSYLDSNNSKYRRGYPGCSYAHSPVNCNGDTLYGDGQMSVGEFSKLDGDNWNRQIRMSSDLNPGDSGSGLYYYRNNRPYVFAVTSAELTCYNTCTGSRPNFARRITPQFFDFINSVVF